MVFDPTRKRRQFLLGATGGIALIALALAALWLPLDALPDLQTLVARAQALRGHPLAPVVLLAVFVIGGLLMLPVTPLVVIAIGAFPPVLGFLLALLGVVLLAMAAFAIGRVAGRRHIERLAGSRVHRVSLRVGEAGVLAVALVRMVPLAHFTAVSLTAGASHVRWRDFVVGTILGMVPGITAVALLYDRAAAAAREPNGAEIAALFLSCAAILTALGLLRGWARRRR